MNERLGNLFKNLHERESRVHFIEKDEDVAHLYFTGNEHADGARKKGTIIGMMNWGEYLGPR